MIHGTGESPSAVGLSRRQVLSMGGVIIASSVSPSLGWSHHINRTLTMHNALTRENLEVEYWVQGEFVPEALKELNYFLRDPHNGKVTEIDPKLYHLIFDIAKKLEAKGTINIMSGYRSPVTNDRLRRYPRVLIQRRPRAVSMLRGRRWISAFRVLAPIPFAG